MCIKDEFQVRSIPPEQTHDWLKRKHYAKRVPQIQYAFGLYDMSLILQGVCTYGSPARMMNNGYGIFGGKYEVPTFELNRLVVNEGLPKNVLSFFVSQTFKMLPNPICLVSYADSNAGHHGYIYQATNWIFTGQTPPRKKFITKDGKDVHESTITHKSKKEQEALLQDLIIDEQEGKFRYLQFLGNRNDVKKMRSLLAYDVQPYPKGDNSRYDASYKPSTQGSLF